MATDQNRQTVLRWLEAINQHDADRLRDCFADDATAHFPGPTLDRDEYVDFMRTAWQGMGELHTEVFDILADGDMVAIRSRNTAEHQQDIPEGIMGPFEIPASGNHLEWEDSDWFRCDDDGRIVEYWNFSDALGMLEQMGMQVTEKVAASVR